MPESLNPAQLRAAAAYKSNQYQGLSERAMMAQLYQKLINHLYLSRDAYSAGNLEMVAEQNGKVIHILDVLREELIGSEAHNDAEAALPAKFMIGTYTDLISRVANVLQKKPVVDEFNAIIEVLKPIYQAWAAPETPGESAASAQG